MPYGRQGDGSYALGALDLYDIPETLPLPMMGTETQQIGGEDDTTSNDPTGISLWRI